MDKVSEKNTKNWRGLHGNYYHVYGNHGMLDRAVAGARYPGVWCADIDGPGAIRRCFDGGGNQPCCIGLLHCEDLCHSCGGTVNDGWGDGLADQAVLSSGERCLCREQ